MVLLFLGPVVSVVLAARRSRLAIVAGSWPNGVFGASGVQGVRSVTFSGTAAPAKRRPLDFLA